MEASGVFNVLPEGNPLIVGIRFLRRLRIEINPNGTWSIQTPKKDADGAEKQPKIAELAKSNPDHQLHAEKASSPSPSKVSPTAS